MPGHKGQGILGIEPFDITEISGADVLYSPSGIILESENNASSLFGTEHTYYSAEGSTLAIKAMLAIAMRSSKSERPRVLAARNVHKAFVYAAALLDFGIEWLIPESQSHIASGIATPCQIKRALAETKELPFAVYITSPDYLGVMADIEGISAVCREYGVPLLVDNAHGAYLSFLDEKCHPIKLGAAMCCDSAHKTLPVLTGGAYLHISGDYSDFAVNARDMLSLFASTSPSYPILASLDLCNKYIAESLRDDLRKTYDKVLRIKARLSELGFSPEESEPLKIVIKASEYGYTGYDIAEVLRTYGCECELADREYLVLMITPENKLSDFEALISAFEHIAPKTAFAEEKLSLPKPQSVLSIREAIFAPSEEIAVADSVGRILSQPSVSCPPAVPIAVCGERITDTTVKLFAFYGIEKVSVIK